jgi:hypothetical protein
MLAVWICAALLLPLGGVAGATDDPGPVDPNVRIVLTTGRAEGGSEGEEKTYRLITRADGPPAKLLMGWRMPIPTTRSATELDEGEPEVSFVYQNVGMSAHLETRFIDSDRVLVRGIIEISGKKDAPDAERDPSHPPVIGTFQQDLSVVLRDGEPLRVAEVPDPEGNTLYMDLRVDVMR